MSRIKEMLKPIVLPILESAEDRRATRYLKKLSERKHPKGKPMKIGFIVFEPEVWDKLDRIYQELVARDDTEVKMIIVPSYDQKLALTKEYGKELDFFKAIDPEAILACGKDGDWIDISRDGYDYIFYQDPYNAHMPPPLRSDHVVKFAKICYIPYGYVGSAAFNEGVTNKPFFRNVYCEFTDIEEIRDIQNTQFKENVEKGYQRFVRMGYPAIMDLYNPEPDSRIKRILWTPRWSYDPQIGGSNFFENKDHILDLADQYPDVSIRIRPHPMMFRNFINEGRMTEEEKEAYLQKLKEKHIEISQGKALKDDLLNADLLITDYSSIIPQFLMTGKPVIYCQSTLQLNSTFTDYTRGMYMTENWTQAESALTALLKGEDPLRETRQRIIAQLVKENENAAKRITEYLIRDYADSAE